MGDTSEAQRAGGQFTRGSIALLISVAANALGGLLLWLIAARIHETEAVGDASALFQSVLFVNFASSLGLPILIAHHAVGRSTRATHVMNVAMHVRTASALCAGGLFLAAAATTTLLDPLWTFGSVQAVTAYLALTVGAGLSVLFESRLITLRRWDVLVARSVFVAVSRLPLILLIGTDATGDDAVLTLFAFAVGPLALSGFVGIAWLRLGVDRPSPQSPRRLEDAAHLRRYALVNWLGLVCTQGPIFMIPVIVAFNIDGSENAPFYVAWSFGAMAFLLPQMIGQVVLSEATQSRAWVRLLLRALELALALTMICAVGALVGSSLVARVYGPEYSSITEHLPLLVGAAVGWSYTSIGLAASRLRERYGDIVLISVVFLLSTVGPTLIFTPRYGATAATWCWLIGNCVTAALTAARYRRWRLDGDVLDQLTRLDPAQPLPATATNGIGS